MFIRLIAAIALMVLPAAIASADDPQSSVTVVFDQELPNAPGMSMRVVLVEYPPGGASPSHTHPATAFIYATVLEGAIRSKVNDGPEEVFEAGESWTEMPGDHHVVSANASDSEPAKLKAVFILESSETNLVTVDPQ